MADKTQAQMDADHAALMRDVANTEAAARAGTAKAEADLEANDPGSRDPNRTDMPSIGQPQHMPGVVPQNNAPF